MCRLRLGNLGDLSNRGDHQPPFISIRDTQRHESMFNRACSTYHNVPHGSLELVARLVLNSTVTSHVDIIRQTHDVWWNHTVQNPQDQTHPATVHETPQAHDSQIRPVPYSGTLGKGVVISRSSSSFNFGLHTVQVRSIEVAH